MSNVLQRLKTHFVHWREWEWNAVVVKELRQAVRSWSVTGMLLLFLAVLFCTALGLLVSQSFAVGVNQRIGATIFQVFLVILAGASTLFIPTYIGVRLAAERQESNLDLLYVSTLSPGSIIRGKLLCGAYTTLLFFSACMPFMAFTTLLRGIDLPTIFTLLAYLFFFICAAVQVAVFLACLPISRAFKVLIGLVGLVMALVFVTSLAVNVFIMMRSGMVTVFAMRGVTTGFYISLAVAIAGLLLLYFLSVALISPPSANRALPLRLYVTIVWVLSAVASIYWVRRQSDPRLIYPWAILTFQIMAPALIVVISNHDQLSLRVRRKIPAKGLKRAVAFLFFNGAAGGLAWAALLMCSTLAVTFAVKTWTFSLPSAVTGISDVAEFVRLGAVAVAYSLAYALTGLLLHRKLFARRTPKLAGLLCVLIAAGTSLIPMIVLFVGNKLSLNTFEKLQPGSVFNAFAVKHAEDQMIHLYVALAWLFVVALLSLKWFRMQVKNFRPIDRAAESLPQPQPPAMPPPLPAQP